MLDRPVDTETQKRKVPGARTKSTKYLAHEPGEKVPSARTGYQISALHRPVAAQIYDATEYQYIRSHNE